MVKQAPVRVQAPEAVASRSDIIPLFRTLKGRPLNSAEWGEAYNQIAERIIYTAGAHNKPGCISQEVYVIMDADGWFHVWLIQCDHQSLKQDAAIIRVFCESGKQATKEQGLREACEVLINAEVVIFFTEEEEAELLRDAIFKVEYAGSTYLINTNTGDSGYTYTKYYNETLELEEQHKFFDLEEVKQTIRATIVNDLQNKLLSV